MLDIAFGASRSSSAVDSLVNALQGAGLDGTLYIGYPLLASVEGTIQLDALLTCKQHGVVAFDLSSVPQQHPGERWLERLEQVHNDIYVNLTNKLMEHRDLRHGRRLAFEIATVTLLPQFSGEQPSDQFRIASPLTLRDSIAELPPLEDGLLQHLNAAIQRTTTIKPRKKRANATTAYSRGTSLREIEQQIANLDHWQKRAAIEFPDGPQRIRGLAGSGKTIVLAQKASLLHSKYPGWDIVVTFNTRSLYQQFRNLILRFSFEMIRDEPDWSKLRIIHAWGSLSSAGVYSDIARAAGQAPKDFGYAKDNYGYGQAFAGVCREVLKDVSGKSLGLFDAILIDEAQDFPQEFLELAYLATKAPNRVVYAYDELQNLGDYTMPPAEKLFGSNSDGTARVRLVNRPGQPMQDIILPVCYRNTPWALATAHALGFGVYRGDGLVQMFDDPALWSDIGYEIRGGALKSGEPVSLGRRSEASPRYFGELLKQEDAVQAACFETPAEEADWIAKQIKVNLTVDELDYDDILIIVADPLVVRSAGTRMMRSLQSLGIESHLAGVTASRDVLFYEKSIAITSIHRAKGNEAPVVYVMGADRCYRGWDLSKKRNILFTAITRSRAWVRVCGIGPAMAALKQEIATTFEHEFRLDFRYPTEEEIKKLKQIHRDRSQEEKAGISRDIEGMERLLRMIENGEIAPDSLPERVQDAVRAMARNL